MSKKNLLLALAVASAAMLALPAAASATEGHIEGITGFTGGGGAGSIVATGEPTITWESTHVNKGVVNAGGTTGTMELDFTGCHATVFGFTVKCHTTGSPLDNTVRWPGTVHIITYEASAGVTKPALLFTPSTIEITTAGISNTHIEGNGVIGTITSPLCGAESTTMTVAFSATGPTQNHIKYTGVNYDLKAKTSGGSSLTAGLTVTVTLTANEAKKLKLNCT